MEVGSKELRNRLSEILDRVERGERVIVRRRGHTPVALAPLVSNVSRLPSLAAFRARLRVRGRPMSKEVIAARRDERA
ncbi:MAG: type II toxin-antitoxin system prevent-host-death family antitoxin [Betaproteobacteria bacterium]|nr:type II toxin-antitoxin system prevent-host-death family antitoxin [Betaproteobacteria bacterium]